MKKPIKSHTLTLHFDTKAGVENFKAWYLDGGGEQISKYFTETLGKDWMYLKPPENSCPNCEYWDEYEIGFNDFPNVCPNFCGYKK